MSAERGSTELSWPPLKDDLLRLYIDQKLSAAKIAEVYGLRYANPKTAESTILHHLKKNEIARRDAAAHIRKVTDSMVDEWVVRYQHGESLKQIAGDSFQAATVFNHLHKRGLRLRDKVEAQIEAVRIHPKQPFSGDLLELAYLSGFAVGDLSIARHGRAVRAKLSTTHPAMAALFRNLFSASGPIYEYPRLNEIVGHQWAFDCDLDSSFEFLLAAKRNPMEVVQDERMFLSFLAGFFDAEGSIYFHKKGKSGAFELSITNTNLELLREIAARLTQLGFHSVLREVRVDRETAIESGMTNPSEFMWRIPIWRHEDVNRLLRTLALRHPERMVNAKIALRFALEADSAMRVSILAEWDALIRSIRIECQNYIASARITWEAKHRPKHHNETETNST
jgi:hypothetical protein